MWSSFSENCYISNNLVESYFRHVKSDILQNKLRLKPGRVIKAISEDTRGKINILKYNIPKKKIKNPNADSERVDGKEKWNSKINSPNWFSDNKGNY